MTAPAACAAPLHAVSLGEGFPVVALHGWTLDHRVMVGMLEPVFAQRPGYRRLYLDLPGMGRSAAGPEMDSSDAVLEAVLATISREIGDQPFLVVGQSYGGYLARAVARVLHDQVAGVALICPVGTAVLDADRLLPPKTVVLDDPALLAGLPDDVAGSFREIAVVQTAEALARYQAEILTGFRAADHPALERIFQRWALATEPEDGPAVAAPSLIVAGRQDHWVGYEDQYSLLAHYPRATYAVLDAAGHNVQLEAPAEVERLLLSWVDRAAAARG